MRRAYTPVLGLLGLFGIDVVARLLGDMTTASRAVYMLVGIAAVYAIYLCAGKLPAKASPCSQC